MGNETDLQKLFSLWDRVKFSRSVTEEDFKKGIELLQLTFTPLEVRRRIAIGLIDKANNSHLHPQPDSAFVDRLIALVTWMEDDAKLQIRSVPKTDCNYSPRGKAAVEADVESIKTTAGLYIGMIQTLRQRFSEKAE